MIEFHNLNGKRVCDISRDRKFAVIMQKGYVTIISANPDGTLAIVNKPPVAEKYKPAV